MQKHQTPAKHGSSCHRAEIQEAALQYVRKVSGYRKPSKANEEAFQRAIDEIAESTRKMLENLRLKASQ
ncbi:DUF2277 domain-containing protein [Candidatus Villigracilis affinis]|uniref:DUF2277 domain-containing protein n=1 Tax=Candidatus Villigracilis affinis TaxID=3140682 RepID=UPI0031E9D780